MIIKPEDFWINVARDVAKKAHEQNPEVPLWKDLDDRGQQTMILLCQWAVRAAAKRGKALLPYEPEPDAA